MNAQPADRIMRIREVERRTGLSRATIYRRIADKSFPEQVPLGGTSVGWRESDITRWIATRGQAVQS